MHDFLAAHLHAGNGRIGNADDAVSSQDAHFFAGTFWDRLYDEKRILQYVELHSDAFEGAFQGLCKLLGV